MQENMLHDKVQVSPRAETQTFYLTASLPAAAVTSPEPECADSFRTLRLQTGPDELTHHSAGTKPPIPKAQRPRGS